MEQERGGQGERGGEMDAEGARSDKDWSKRDPEGPDLSGSRDGGTGPAPTAPGPAPKRTDKAEPSPTWLEILLPVLVVLILFVLALLWNIVAAIVVLIIGAGVILSWVIQRRQPHEPGE